eukprot:gb/GECH01008505.1/.p1 GENE.gb/GECH01008505.1/~~gb/GECH01008505.1/.p1  ORF type:complete len:150 (+),score=16.67 gb/GECH01008505.1/:1-450(+)
MGPNPGSSQSSGASPGGSSSQSSSSKPKLGPNDFSKKELNEHYNEKVVSAKIVERPIDSSDKKSGPFDHIGVSYTTESGKTMLLHNTPGSGVVTTNTPMSKNWTVKQDIEVKGDKSVGGMMRNAGAGKAYMEAGCCPVPAEKTKKYLSK